jgi:Fe-S-cluster containining protein
MSLSYELSHTRQRYRELFTSARDSLFSLINAQASHFSCSHCPPPSSGAASEEVLQPRRHDGCGYQAWQLAAIEMIEQQIARDILTRLKRIEADKARVTCHSCGVCCRLASSEYSYEELEERAAAGDSFAKQFTGIFIPYASEAAAREKFPELVASVLKEAQKSDSPGSVHFYHCPYIGEDNRCSIYGTAKRPQICASYPDTPLTFIYEKCAWKPWKDDAHDEALLAHAMIELCSWTVGKLREITSAR